MGKPVYGQRVPGLVVEGRAIKSGVVDERQVRAAAGLTLVLGAVAFVYAAFAKIYWPIQIVTIVFFVDFVLRVSLGLEHSLTGRLSALLTRGRPPQWVSAKPKRFAWSIGVVMSLAMVAITNSGIRGALPLTICMVCLVLMWLEAVLGLCLGCEIYAFMQRRGWVAKDKDIEVCADGVCALPERGAAPGASARPAFAATAPSALSSSSRTASAGVRLHPERIFNLKRTVRELAEVRQNWRAARQRSTRAGTRELPSTEVLREVIEDLRGILFPMRLGPADLRQENEDFFVGHKLDRVLRTLFKQVRLELREGKRRLHRGNPVHVSDDAAALVQAFAEALPRIRELLDGDTLAAYEGDPAAHSVDEVLLCYPGMRAMICHRIAHVLYTLGTPIIARMIAEIAHGQTGIDIHPGARIGPRFFIDHGTGVVIGETAIIGEGVRLYQAVTLGARSFPVDEKGHARKGEPRHPIVEDGVVIYAGATVLGRVTIGRGAVIGGNVWVTHDVAPGENVRQAVPRHEAGQSAKGGHLPGASRPAGRAVAQTVR